MGVVESAVLPLRRSDGLVVVASFNHPFSHESPGDLLTSEVRRATRQRRLWPDDPSETSDAGGVPAMRHDLFPLPVSAVIPRRKVRALVTVGWSMAEQYRRSGVSHVWALARGYQEQTSQHTADAVASMYAELRDMPGPSTRARNLGRREGWPPPSAWGDRIDDPAAAPGECCIYCGARWRR